MMDDFEFSKKDEQLAFEFLEGMAPEENKFFEYWLRPYYQNGVNIQIQDLIGEYKTQMKSIADYLAKEDYMILGRGKGVFVVSKIIIEDEKQFGNKRGLGLRVIFNKEKDHYGERESYVMSYGTTLVDCLFDSLEHRNRLE